MEHVLIIGGGGLLRKVSLHFAENGQVVSVVGRDKSKIIEMVAATQKAPGLINPIAVDYTDIPALRQRLIEAVAHLKAPVLTIVRINPKAVSVRPAVAQFLREQATGCPMFDLLCFDGGISDEALVESMGNFEMKYRRIYFGDTGDAGASRMSAGDICAGVLEAIERDEDGYVIGGA